MNRKRKPAPAFRKVEGQVINLRDVDRALSSPRTPELDDALEALFLDAWTQGAEYSARIWKRSYRRLVKRAIRRA